MEANFEGGQGPEGAVVRWMDGWINHNWMFYFQDVRSHRDEREQHQLLGCVPPVKKVLISISGHSYVYRYPRNRPRFE